MSKKYVPRHSVRTAALLPNGFGRTVKIDPKRNEAKFQWYARHGYPFAAYNTNIYFYGTLVENPDGVSLPVFKPHADEAWMFLTVLNYIADKWTDRTALSSIELNDRRNYPEFDPTISSTALAHCKTVLNALKRTKLPNTPPRRFRCYWTPVTGKPLLTFTAEDMVGSIIQRVEIDSAPTSSIDLLNKIAQAQTKFGLNVSFLGEEIPMTYFSENPVGHVMFRGAFIQGRNLNGHFLPNDGQSISL